MGLIFTKLVSSLTLKIHGSVVLKFRCCGKLQNHKEIKDFIEKNGDDILSQLEKAQHASKEDTEAASLLRTYQRLVDLLTAEGIILSNVGLKLAIARETENDIDEYEYDPRIIRAIDQLRVFKIYQSTLKTDNPE